MFRYRIYLVRLDSADADINNIKKEKKKKRTKINIFVRIIIN
jgi:hypothetical protein